MFVQSPRRSRLTFDLPGLKPNSLMRLWLVCQVLLLLSFSPPSFAEDYSFVMKWDSQGSRDWQFNYPTGIAIDGSGNVYVVDAQNHRIQKFTANGQLITQWGSKGSGDGQFDNYSEGIAVDSSGNVYVVGSQDNRIQKFTADGQFITKWGSYGTWDGQFRYPFGIAVDSSGNVYVADSSNGRIQKFTANGEFIAKWGSFGSGDGQFGSPPYGIAIDSSGNVYVAAGYHIQKFTANGELITKWGSQGDGDGQFNLLHASGVAVDSSGNVYVAERRNHRIQKFTANGEFITKFGNKWLPDQQFIYDGQFSSPRGIAVDSSGNVYVSDLGSPSRPRIQKFAPANSNAPTASFTATPANGSAPLTVELDASASSDSDGKVVEYDYYNYTVNGQPIALDTNTASYEVQGGSVETVSVNGSNVTVKRRFLTLVFKANGNYTVGLKVKDNSGLFSTEVYRTVSVGQNCTYSISPTSKTHSANAETGSVAVTASNSACAWTASSNQAWTSVTSGSSGTGSTSPGGTGNGTLSYSVDPNTTGVQRTGTLTIAGQTFSINQAVLSYPLNISKTGSGTVVSNPAGIDCGADCTEDYALNTVVTLTATPTSPATFIGWSGDCSGTATSTTVTMDAAKNCTATMGFVLSGGKPLAFYLPGGNYSGSAFLRMTNDTDNPVSLKGTLYDANGAVIGNPNALLTTLAGQQTLALSMPTLATALGVSGWQDLTWLELTEPSSGITVMNTYRNENGTLTNMTSVSENAAYLLPGSTNPDTAQLVLVNTSADPVQVVGSLYHQDGYLLGQAQSVLVNVLPAHAMRVLNASDLEQLTSSGAWTGRAWLSLQPVSGLVMMNVIIDTSAVVSNFTSARADGNYNIPSSISTDKSYTRLTNTTDAPLPLYATLYHQNGSVLGTPNSLLLNTLPARATRVLANAELESLFGVTPWTGRSRLILAAPDGAVQVIGTIRSPTFSQGSVLVSASEMSNSKLYNLPASNNLQDIAYVRISNTSSNAVTVMGTLYSQDGPVLGNANAMLIPTLQSGETQVLDMLTLQQRSGYNQPWTGRARLVISEPTSGIQLMGMIRSRQSNILTNMSAVRTIQ